MAIHIYGKICIKHAHKIENYTLLFGSVYVGVNKIVSDKYLSDDFIAKTFNIGIVKALQMVMLVEEFMDTNDIYFGSKEKESLISYILS